MYVNGSGKLLTCMGPSVARAGSGKELAGLRGEVQGGIDMEKGAEVFVLDFRNEGGVVDNEHVVASRRVATRNRDAVSDRRRQRNGER